MVPRPSQLVMKAGTVKQALYTVKFQELLGTVLMVYLKFVKWVFIAHQG
jgi:hypothetical protein